MSYQALLFCPDEKTARVVTQVLTELDFTVEPCNEPFAAVKRLMAQHFDAVVVDCDNEQNATLLFKSARNSGTNQSSLSVAVVEGQAGVAKAFRIGANLVLTKPLNVEQSKGTLRVARGLLRKGEAAPKPASDAMPRSAAAQTSPAATKPATAHSEPPVFSAPKVPVPPPAPMASSSSFELEAEHTPEPEPTEAAFLESIPDPPPPSKPAASSGSKEYAWQPVSKLSEPMASALKRAAEVAATSKPSQEEPAVSNLGLESTQQTSPSWGVSGQGAAAAPAKEPAPAARTIEFKAPTKPASPADQEEEITPSSQQFEPPTFSTLAVKDHEEVKAGEKKSPILWIVIAAVVIAGVYFGWTRMHNPGAPADTPTPVVHAPAPAPAATQPSATVTASPLPATSELPGVPVQSTSVKPAKPSPAEPSATTMSKPDAEVETEQPAPMVVKKDEPRAQAKTAEVEAPQAPGVLGLAGTGDQTAISGIVASTPVAVPKPVAQTVKVSQGVSQGLITKRVQPVYPQQALQMRLQGAVQLEAAIGKDGSITSVKVLKGDSILARAAVAAVKQWKYKPYFLNGEPVAVQTEVTVNFKLP